MIYIDVGNSRVKWQLSGEPDVHSADSIEELRAQWQALAPVKPQNLTGCNVRGADAAQAINQVASSIFGSDIIWQSARASAFGVVNGYQLVENLGADRWAALVGARAQFPGSNCIVVDAGTAITVDLLDQSGQHRGGVILPGVKLMFDSLGRARQLSSHADASLLKANALADSTQGAIVAGVNFSIQGGVNAVIQQQVQQINVKIEDLPIILTGGDASMIQLNAPYVHYAPLLVLDGLKVMAEAIK